MIEIAPSILAADFTRLGEQVHEALAAGVRRIHVDVMDGQFVPSISMGPLVCAALRPLAARFGALLEVHLMVVAAERHVADFRAAGADLILVHVESEPHLFRTIQSIRALGARPGVVLSPASPLALLEEVLPVIDQVLVMTVDPGAGGQPLIPLTLDKVARLRDLLAARGLETITIEVDGGINHATIAAAATAGATLAVAGSAVFNTHGTVAENLQALRAAANA
ncbi:MAG: ribulose-phosphate 3-epimerase [Chloroflexi bacterium]|nr:ribulose-phosphate 3-epimerase [Chloroflexota bacterium]